MFRNNQWGNVDEMCIRRLLVVAKHSCISCNNPKWPFKTVDFYISFQLYYILFLWHCTVSKSMDSSSVTSLIPTGQPSLEMGIYLCHFLHLYLTLQLSFPYHLCLLAVGLLRPVLQNIWITDPWIQMFRVGKLWSSTAGNWEEPIFTMHGILIWKIASFVAWELHIACNRFANLNKFALGNKGVRKWEVLIHLKEGITHWPFQLCIRLSWSLIFLRCSLVFTQHGSGGLAVPHPRTDWHGSARWRATPSPILLGATISGSREKMA